MDVLAAAADDAVSHRPSRTVPKWLASLGATAVSSVLAAVLTLAVAASPAAATSRTGEPGQLEVVQVGPSDGFARLAPGSTEVWQLRVTVPQFENPELQLSLGATGDLAQHPEGIDVTISSCSQQWTGTVCAGRRHAASDAVPLTAIGTEPRPVGTFAASAVEWLLVEIALADDANPPQSTSGTMVVGVAARAEPIVPGVQPPEPPVPVTVPITVQPPPDTEIPAAPARSAPAPSLAWTGTLTQRLVVVGLILLAVGLWAARRGELDQRRSES